METQESKDIKAKIEQYLGQFGEIYMPDDIKIEKNDLIGLENPKSLLNSFFKALKDYSESSLKFKFPMPIIFSSLLVGPPGTGKTTLAKAFAKEYEIPIIVIFSNALIGSLLGESLNRVKNLLRQAEIYAKDKLIILFFDEIDAISSERANAHDVGEIKRMVISFLQELDLILEKQLHIGVIGATNHPGQLDKAVWRRFTFKIDFPPPSDEIRVKLFKHFLKKIDDNEDFKLSFDMDDKDNLKDIKEISTSMTGADIERAFQIAILQSYSSQDSQSEKKKIYFTYEILKKSIQSVKVINSNDSQLINQKNSGIGNGYDNSKKDFKVKSGD